MSSSNRTDAPPVENEPAVGKGTTVMIIMIVIALSLVVFFNYLMKLKRDAREGRPGTEGRIETSVTLTERSGEQVSISDLQGRVIVAGLLSTEDPLSVGFLKSMQSQFGRDGRLQIVSFAVDPEKETAEVLDAFAEKEEIKGDNWWLVTGPEKTVRGFVVKELDLRGVKDTADGVEAYDRRLVIADEKGQIRGRFDVANPDPDLADAERLKFQKALTWVMAQGIPIYRPLEKEITLTERSGEPVNTADLKGKLRLAAYVYTRCPNGCAGVVAFMDQIRKEFAEDPRLHLLSFSLDADYDTPEILAKWADSHGVEADNWWFLTGDKEKIQEFMIDGIGFLETVVKPEAERLTEADIYAHDMRIALIDTENRVRTFYDVMNNDPATAELAQMRLMQDVRTLLEESPE